MEPLKILHRLLALLSKMLQSPIGKSITDEINDINERLNRIERDPVIQIDPWIRITEPYEIIYDNMFRFGDTDMNQFLDIINKGTRFRVEYNDGSFNYGYVGFVSKKNHTDTNVTPNRVIQTNDIGIYTYEQRSGGAILQTSFVDIEAIYISNSDLPTDFPGVFERSNLTIDPAGSMTISGTATAQFSMSGPVITFFIYTDANMTVGGTPDLFARVQLEIYTNDEDVDNDRDVVADYADGVNAGSFTPIRVFVQNNNSELRCVFRPQGTTNIQNTFEISSSKNLLILSN